MALRAVPVVSDSLLDVLAGDIRGGVLMASVTGVLPEICRIVVAGLATRPMIAIEPEVAVVVEVRRFPDFGSVAGRAVGASICVETVFGQVALVAFEAALARSQRFVVEVCRFPCLGAMAGRAVDANVCVETILGQVALVTLEAALACSQRFVVEAGRFPCLGAMAGRAVVASARVDVILWLLAVMAGGAICPQVRAEAFVPERA